MAVQNSSVVKIEFDNSSGVLQDMTQYVTDSDPMVREGSVEETTPFGASAETYASDGVEKNSQMQLKGPYDDTAATGPHVIFNDVLCKNTAGGTRTLKYTYGNGKTTSVETIILSYSRDPKVKKLTGYAVKLQKTGNVTEV